MSIAAATVVGTVRAAYPQSGSALGADTTATRGKPTGRPRIILIHGRAQEYRVDSQLRSEWIGALRDGLRKVGMDSTNVKDDDVEMISYQDAFEPEMPTPDGCEPSELTAERYTKAQGSTTFGSRIFSPRYHSVILPLRDRLARTLPSPALVTGALSDVEIYFQRNGGIACAVNSRVRDRLRDVSSQGHPIVLAAHSLGSLVAYRVLTQAAANKDTIHISRLITFGSQLPYRRLLTYFMPDSAKDPFPAGADEWVNIIGLGDLAAFSAREERAYRGHDHIVELHVATDPTDPHSAIAYLKNPITALAIARGWCNAFAVTGRPRKCDTLRYQYSPDVTDALTPERFERLPLISGIITSDIFSGSAQRPRYGAEALIPALSLLPYVPSQIGIDWGSGFRSFAATVAYPLAIAPGLNWYPEAGAGRVDGFQGGSRVAIAGVGVRLALAPLVFLRTTGDAFGLAFDRRFEFAAFNGHPRQYTRLGLYINLGGYIETIRRNFLTPSDLAAAQLACGAGNRLERTASGSLLLWITAPSDSNCLGLVRFAASPRRQLRGFAKAATEKNIGVTATRVDSLLCSCEDVLNAEQVVDKAWVAHATDLIQALAHVSAAQPDVIVLPVSLAKRYGSAAIATLGSDSAFRHVATIVVVPKRDSATLATCEALRVTACEIEWSEQNSTTVFATAFAMQEHRVWKDRGKAESGKSGQNGPLDKR